VSTPTRVWVNGRLVDAAKPQLRVDDRGFQLGDGAFETLRARRGVVIELAEHLARLRESTSALSIRLPLTDNELLGAITDLLAAEGLDSAGDDARSPGDASLRITVSRGPIERRGLLPEGIQSVAPSLVIQAWPYVPPPATVLERGVTAITATIRRDPRSPLAGVKSTSRADYVHARLEAESAGADDALFLTTDGRLSEATTSNVFAIRGDRLSTPGRNAAILAGTTRTWLLASAATLGFRPDEADLRPDDLVAADEAFLSSSVAGIIALVRVDGQAIGAGRPGRATLRLREAREAWIDECSRAGARANAPRENAPRGKP
jgi:branched-chain amino acid aminotransferase